MDCSEFQENHCAFVDDMLPGVELVRMQGHLNECESCSRLDVKIRRSLMAIQSLPTIQLSADFSARLERRLQECRESADAIMDNAGAENFKTVVAVGTIASMLMLGYMATSLHNADKPRDIVLPPVVAMAHPPEQELLPMFVPAVVASVSTGMPLWSAAMFAQEMPLRVENARASR